MTSPTPTDRFALKLGLLYAAYFLFGGIQLPFFPLWLEARGLDPQIIGAVVAVPTLVRILVVPLVAHQADRHGALKAALVISAGGGALALVVVGLASGTAAIIAAYVAAAMAFAPLLALSDAYALSGLGVRGRAYGPVRLWGSAAFIVSNVGAGFLLAVISPGRLIWLLVAALAATSLAAAALVPIERSRPLAAGPAPVSGGPWRGPLFWAVVGAASLVQGSHALFYGFSTLDWRAAGLEGSTIGFLWGLGVLAEIVLFAFSARLPAWMGPTALLAAGAAGAVLRWTAMAFEPPVALLPLLQILHAASFAATHLGTMGFLALAAPRGRIATAQGLVSTVSGIVMAAATALSGLVYAAAGSLAYLGMAAMALAGLGCAVAAHRMRGRLVVVPPV